MNIIDMLEAPRGPCKECGHPTFHRDWCRADILDNWKRCPSTHCERRQECASPGDCNGTGRKAAS